MLWGMIAIYLALLAEGAAVVIVVKIIQAVFRAVEAAARSRTAGAAR
jgi:hypothetical protein